MLGSILEVLCLIPKMELFKYHNEKKGFGYVMPIGYQNKNDKFMLDLF
jgi:hypothetical protein